MKKLILILLFFTGFLHAQTLKDAAFSNTTTNTLKVKNNVQDNLATKIPVQSSDGSINWINKSDLTIQTTAGTFTRINFTGDVSVVNSVNYYATNTANKGSTASVAQTVSPDDNQKLYFAQDYISVLQPSLVIYPIGNYSGQFAVQVANNSVQQKFYIEVYKTNSLGVPIASGVSGAPIGSLGVQLITTLESGLVSLTGSVLTNITFTGTLTGPLTVNANERIKYHIAAEKVGTAGGAISMQIFSGSDYNSYYDVPVPVTSDGVTNKVPGLGNTVTEALNLLNNKLNYVTPEQYGAIGDGITDDSTPMQNAINSGKMVLIGAKTYLLNSTMNIINPVKIFGAGNLSVLKTTQNLPVLNIASNLVALKDFKILGNGRGTVTDYATTRPLQNGIKIDGAFYNNTVENIIFDSLGNAGIYGANNQNGVSTDVTSSINVNSCFFFNSLFGINFDTLFEYNLVYNSVFKNNETGIVIKGGNNPMIGGHVLNNRTGVSVISGSNDSHSTLSSVTINHNVDYGISVGAIVNGFTFSNCIVFFNSISLVNSNGVSIDGGLFKNNAPLVFTNTESTTLQNVKFTSTSIPTTFSGNTNLRFFNNSYPLGTSVPAAMKESIENITNNNILDVNATAATTNLLRMRVNGSNRYLIGSDAGITGGNDADLNTYVYGNNNYFVSTNGVKRLTISGSGLSTFTGNVAIPNGTAPSHAVNKGQLDLKADLASPNLTGTPTAPTPAPGTNTNQVVTAAFVQAAISTSGTFTPASGGNVTYLKSYWIKSGNVVTVTLNGTITGTTTGSQSLTLPNSFAINSPVNNRIIGTNIATLDSSAVNGQMVIYEQTVNTLVKVNFSLPTSATYYFSTIFTFSI